MSQVNDPLVLMLGQQPQQVNNSEANLSLVDENYLYRNLIFFSILLSVLLSLVIFCLVVTNWYQQVIGWPVRGGGGSEERMEGRRRTRVRRALDQTTIEHWTDEDNGHGHFHQSACVICLEDFQNGDRVRKLNCEHVFHLPCVDNWILKMKAACPICKRRLVRKHQPKTSEASSDPEVTAEESESDRPELVTLTPGIRMNPRGEASPVLLFATPASPPEQIQRITTPRPRPRNVLVEYFQTPEDAELNRGGRREILLDFPLVEVSPIPITPPLVPQTNS